LASHQLLRLRTNTIRRDDDIRFVALPVICRAPSFPTRLVFKVIDDSPAEFNVDPQLLDLPHEHLVDERSHLERSGGSIGIQTGIAESLGDRKWLYHLLSTVLEGLDPCIVDSYRVVLGFHFGPMLEELGGTEAHKVHVSRGVDGGIPFQDPDLVAFSDAF
jgi:hypothetical protein